MPKSLDQNQQQIRQQIRQIRRDLSPQQNLAHSLQALKLWQQWYSAIFSQKNSLPRIRVAVFLSQDGEMNTQPLIEYLWCQANIEVYLPHLQASAGNLMQFARYQADSTLESNHLKMVQPVPNRADDLISADTLNLVLTPLVAFDDKGNRVGMGGGFYDRTFAFKKALKHSLPPQALLIGWAHECQKVTALQRNDWDVPLDLLISEKQIRCFNE